MLVSVSKAQSSDCFDTFLGSKIHSQSPSQKYFGFISMSIFVSGCTKLISDQTSGFSLQIFENVTKFTAQRSWFSKQRYQVQDSTLSANHQISPKLNVCSVAWFKVMCPRWSHYRLKSSPPILMIYLFIYLHALTWFYHVKVHHGILICLYEKLLAPWQSQISLNWCPTERTCS